MRAILIDKDLIFKAKEKLRAEENFKYIMQFLGVNDYDERNMKCCCPFHGEDTASFVMNPKTYSAKCFGCGISIDILDAYIRGQNKTFPEAVQKLFELAGITYSFGSLGVKERRQYKYPKEVPETDNLRAYEYLATRKISKHTADHFGVRDDGDGNMAFRYFDTSNNLCMVKYRPARKVDKGENKNWCQHGADTVPLLYGMNLVNTSEPLVICEGEIDAMAIYEAGYSCVVSVPLGAGNFHWIEENFDWLDQFTSIIICSDNDTPGLKMQKEVVYRLGSWRTKVVDIPPYFEREDNKKIKMKDANEVLFWCGKEALLDLILNAKDTPIPSIVDFSDVEEVDMNEVGGITTGLECIDKEILRLFYGSFNVLSGIPGSGKTSWLYQLVCQTLDQGDGAWVFSRELPNYMSKNWINFLFSGTRNVNEYANNSGAKYYKVKPQVKNEINQHYKGQMFLYRDDYPNDVESLKSSMVDSARKYGSKLFLIDNLMTVDLNASDDNKYEKQSEFINWLISFSSTYNVCTLLVCHPRKLQFGQKEVGMYDMAGSSNIINLAHRAIGLRRVTKAEKSGERNKRGDGFSTEPCPYDVMVSIIKDRFRGRAGSEFGLFYDQTSRRFFSNPQEYDWQYKWDKNVYSDTLPYPVEDKTDECFGRIGG